MTPITGAARPRLRIEPYQARGNLPPAAAKGLPSAAPSVGRVPPAPYGLRAVTLPTLGGGVAPPAPPAVAVGDMWRPRPRLRRVPAKLAASRCAGAPLRNARPSPCGAGRWPGLALLLPRAGCGAGAPGRPGPHKWGLWGRPPLRPGRRRCGPRPGCATPAALAPLWAGLPAHSPPGVAARRPSLPTAAKPGRRLRPAALPLRGAAISTPRAGAAQVRPFRALRAAGARGNAACGRDGHACERRSRVKCTALCAALDRRSPSRQRGIRRRGPLGPVTDPPPTERSAL